jgi:hypothetical protein
MTLVRQRSPESNCLIDPGCIPAEGAPRPPLDTDDLALLEAATAVPGLELSDESLRALAASRGIDFATAALYRRVRADPSRATFIAWVESAEAPPQPPQRPRVVVMPGAFAREYPHTGADGSRVFELAQHLGWPAERVEIPSLSPMAGNAAALARVLARDRNRPTIVVSLSKGGADVRAALERPRSAEEWRGVRAWVSLSGIVAGTPLVDWLRARPLRCCGVRALLRLRRQRFATVDELRRGPGSPLARPLVPPPGLRVIHVAAFPRQKHLGDAWARRGHARLAPLGPNDGGGILLADVARLPGDLYPVWGADHYLRPPWDIRPLLLRILRGAALDTPRQACAAPDADADLRPDGENHRNHRAHRAHGEEKC